MTAVPAQEAVIEYCCVHCPTVIPVTVRWHLDPDTADPALVMDSGPEAAADLVAHLWTEHPDLCGTPRPGTR